MTLFNNQGYSWSVYHQEPHNTLVNTVAYIGAFIGAMTGQFYVSEKLLLRWLNEESLGYMLSIYSAL